ncbi:MBOAT family O-acyltransferase [Ruminococcus sp.]|jgi:alginate O-acetyltransferase complex protein AlgI|uniref:MBOAT family O-acyltransferase n=1 Tax=Ruminococcus sp. TaxID=41978 RepID=UPI0026122E05|nr:MBOAT family O-acyltransferase [Ruminococcus sp.]MEE0023197.1 MBOAT family O-acyltransferase [Ruminococcus sp.]
MVFSTIEFLFQFLPIFLVGYYLTPPRYRNVTLVAGSLIFYAIGSGWYTLLLILSALINYTLSHAITRAKVRDPHRAKLLFILGLIYDFGMLVVFKYTNFLIGNLNGLLSVFHVSLPAAKLILPLGISFYTFQVTSYLIDVYTKKVRPASSLLELGTFVCMFPQLISGPITNFGEMQPQIQKRRINATMLEDGMQTFILGLGAKTLLANPMGGLWNNLGVIGYDSISTPYAWLGAFAYSFQIYFDFSGYSMMAIGVGKMLGFQLPQNFNLPYMSGSAAEFWRRWHMTLGRWFKNYIYFPLGGSRKGSLKTIRNMLVVWAFTGLWHGASWNFVLWGLIFFVLLVLEKNVYGKFLERTHILKHAYIIFIIPLTWMVFAISDMHQLGTYFTRLFPFLSSQETQSNTRDVMLALHNYWKILIPCVLFCTPLPLHYYKKYRKSGFCLIILILIFIFSIRAMMTQTNNPFLYFQF